MSSSYSVNSAHSSSSSPVSATNRSPERRIQRHGNPRVHLRASEAQRILRDQLSSSSTGNTGSAGSTYPFYCVGDQVKTLALRPRSFSANSSSSSSFSATSLPSYISSPLEQDSMNSSLNEYFSSVRGTSHDPSPIIISVADDYFSKTRATNSR